MAAGLQDCADAGIDCGIDRDIDNFLLAAGLGFVAVMIWAVVATLAGVSMVNTDMSGRHQAMWAVAIVLLPIVGAVAWFVYRTRDR